MSSRNEIENWAMFAPAMAEIRAAFPEHAGEIDQCLRQVGQKLAAAAAASSSSSCGDPNCTCRMRAENFRRIPDKMARRAYEFD